METSFVSVACQLRSTTLGDSSRFLLITKETKVHLHSGIGLSDRNDMATMQSGPVSAPTREGTATSPIATPQRARAEGKHKSWCLQVHQDQTVSGPKIQKITK